MEQGFTHLHSETLLMYSLYGVILLGCVFGSLVASRAGKHTAATVLATTVWAGAALPIAFLSSSIPDGALFINYPLAALSVLGIVQARSVMSTRGSTVSP